MWHNRLNQSPRNKTKPPWMVHCVILMSSHYSIKFLNGVDHPFLNSFLELVNLFSWYQSFRSIVPLVHHEKDQAIKFRLVYTPVLPKPINPSDNFPTKRDLPLLRSHSDECLVDRVLELSEEKSSRCASTTRCYHHQHLSAKKQVPHQMRTFS